MLLSESLLLDVMTVLYLLYVVYRLLEEVVMSMKGEDDVDVRVVPRSRSL